MLCIKSVAKHKVDFQKAHIHRAHVYARYIYMARHIDNRWTHKALNMHSSSLKKYLEMEYHEKTGEAVLTRYRLWADKHINQLNIYLSPVLLILLSLSFPTLVSCKSLKSISYHRKKFPLHSHPFKRKPTLLPFVKFVLTDRYKPVINMILKVWDNWKRKTLQNWSAVEEGKDCLILWYYFPFLLLLSFSNSELFFFHSAADNNGAE